jgi:hypothetical protein
MTRNHRRDPVYHGSRLGRDAKLNYGRVVGPRHPDYGAPLHRTPGCTGWSRNQQALTPAQKAFNEYFAPTQMVAEAGVRGRHLREGKPGAFDPERDDDLEETHLLHLGEEDAKKHWAVVCAMRRLLSYNTDSKEHKKLRAEWLLQQGFDARLGQGNWLLRKVKDLAMWCRKYFRPIQ